MNQFHNPFLMSYVPIFIHNSLKRDYEIDWFLCFLYTYMLLTSDAGYFVPNIYFYCEFVTLS